MRLYKMELYKLCHRKIFVVEAVCVIGIMLIFFWLKVSDERAYVDGISYRGYQAVQVNRQITEEFKGVLTDGKVEGIIAKYGFPQAAAENYNGFMDANFLNDFVMTYLSDGYFHDWSDYKAATCTYPIESTEAGAARRLTGGEIILEYNNGWVVFIDVLQIGMILGVILILFCVSTTFSGEGQAKMLQLLFTAKEGRKKDVYIKIAAAFTVTVIIWAGVAALSLILCGAVFGLDGLDCFVGMTKIAFSFMAVSWSPTVLSVGCYTAITLLRCLIGMLLLCSVTLYISACFRSPFHAITVSAVYTGSPLLLWILLSSARADSFITYILLGVLRILQYSSPFYMIMNGSIFDIYHIWHILAGAAGAASVICVVGAYLRYKRQQV